MEERSGTENAAAVGVKRKRMDDTLRAATLQLVKKSDPMVAEVLTCYLREEWKMPDDPEPVKTPETERVVHFPVAWSHAFGTVSPTVMVWRNVEGEEWCIYGNNGRTSCRSDKFVCVLTPGNIYCYLCSNKKLEATIPGAFNCRNPPDNVRQVAEEFYSKYMKKTE